MRQVEYVKYNRTRAARFQIRTAIICEDNRRVVEKTALTDDAAGHIRSLEEKYEAVRGQNPQLVFLVPEISGDGRTARFSFLEGETLGELLGRQITMGEPPFGAIAEALAFLFPEQSLAGEVFYATSGFEEVFGSVPGALLEEPLRCLPVSNVDGLFENMMLCGGKVYGIDYEWVFDFPIPVKFLQYRNLLYFYLRFEKLLRVTKEEFLAHFDLSVTEQEAFAAMEAAFQLYVHGTGNFQYMQQYEQPAHVPEILLERVHDLETELDKVADWGRSLKEELAERDVTITKQQEVQRLTNNHVANLEIIIKDLRRENTEIAKTLQYLAGHEAVMWKILRKCHQLVEQVMPKGTRKRKVLQYYKNTLVNPAKYGRLYLTADGRNRIRGDFKIGEGYLEHGKLRFIHQETPLVSVIIPVYNQITIRMPVCSPFCRIRKMSHMKSSSPMMYPPMRRRNCPVMWKM